MRLLRPNLNRRPLRLPPAYLDGLIIAACIGLAAFTVAALVSTIQPLFQ